VSFWTNERAKPGHEYTKSNVRFTISVSQTEPIKKLEQFAENNQVTTGKFTIGDEKVRSLSKGGKIIVAY
jgi:hypothetical protein